MQCDTVHFQAGRAATPTGVRRSWPFKGKHVAAVAHVLIIASSPSMTLLCQFVEQLLLHWGLRGMQTAMAGTSIGRGG